MSNNSQSESIMSPEEADLFYKDRLSLLDMAQRAQDAGNYIEEKTYSDRTDAIAARLKEAGY